MVRLALVLLALLVGCGGAAPAPTPSPRRVGPLPPLPELRSPPAQLATGLDAADALLAEVAPEPPPGADAERMGAWLVETYLPWTSAWLERISSVADPLAAASALQPRLRPFASSIVALLFEVARARVVSLPPPADIAPDPSASADWRLLLEEATAPAAAEARGLLAACIELSAGRDDAAVWGADCATRLAALPPTPGDAPETP